MQIWHCNWASLQGAECMNDDGVRLDDLANPNGVLLGDIANPQIIKNMVENEDSDLHDETGEGEWSPQPWTVVTENDHYREYKYGEYFLLMCSLKDVL